MPEVSELESVYVGKGAHQHHARDGDQGKCGRGGLRVNSIIFYLLAFCE